MSACTDFRIGASEAGLLALIYRGIPNPDRWIFVPYSLIYTTADGVSKGDGYPVVSWTWEVLSQQQLNVLLGFFSADTDASVEIYVRTRTERGAKQTTGDYTAVMHRPIIPDDKEMIKDSTHPVWQEVTVRFTRLETV